MASPVVTGMTIKVNEATAARRRVPIYCVDATDHYTPETSEATGQPRIAKNGGTFADTAAKLVSIGYGWYYVELTQTEVNTLGLLVVRYNGSSTDGSSSLVQVVAYDPYDATSMGMSRLDATISSRSTLASDTVDSAVQTAFNTAIPASPTADSPYERIAALDDNYTAARAVKLDNLDAAMTTRATPAQVNAEVIDVLSTDTQAEPGAGAPPATATLAAKIQYLYAGFRNRFTASNTERTLYADNGTTVMCKSTVSDSGSLYDRGEMGAP